MMYKTHIVFAIAVYLILCVFFSFQKSVFVILLIALGSLIPDIDNSKSFINNKLKITRPIAEFSTHRGFWHSIFGVILVLVVLFFLAIAIKIKFVVIGYIVFGMSMHLLADSFTISGIKPFWKFSGKTFRWKIRTNSIVEYLFFVGLLVLCLYLYSPTFFLKIISSINDGIAYVIKNLSS